MNLGSSFNCTNPAPITTLVSQSEISVRFVVLLLSSLFTKGAEFPNGARFKPGDDTVLGTPKTMPINAPNRNIANPQITTYPKSILLRSEK